MAPIEIRRARPDDAEAVEAYHNSCFLKTYAQQVQAGEFRAPDRDGTRQQLLGWFQPESEFRTWVTTVADQPVGHFTIYKHHLVHLFVEPARQGTGLGRTLLARAEAEIAAGGYTSLELHTRVENVRAIAFYKATGWTMTDQVITTIEHGINYDEHIMVKHRG